MTTLMVGQYIFLTIAAYRASDSQNDLIGLRSTPLLTPALEQDYGRRQVLLSLRGLTGSGVMLIRNTR